MINHYLVLEKRKGERETKRFRSEDELIGYVRALEDTPHGFERMTLQKDAA
ncbi:hypothetical protein [Williamsia serinedens]|uniref:Transposase n=1 Tax=Williamsia serinedens TaxID=391736 RepID=A0ABT1HBC5_9NOCA|nr:hypothetical protein [Williamsia serinedens]MCP2163133.1 hypothetical protein [Williamsia serinedens]